MASTKGFRLFADFGQIHVCDPKGTSSLEDAWTAQATDDRVADGGHIVGIGAKDTADVNVSVETLVSPPADDADGWDHVTESSIDVTSGALAVLGCTDELEKAKRFPAAAGTWRVRASHANLAKGREQIRVQLWPAPRQPARVVKRWAPPPKLPRKAPSRIASAKQAVKAALCGETDAALAFFLPRAAQGSFAECVSAVQLLAFRGQWRELIPLAMTVIKVKPEASAGRDTCYAVSDLLRRAAAELHDPSLITEAIAQLSPENAAEATRHLQGKAVASPKTPTAEDRAAFAAHASSPATEARFRGKAKDRAAHLMAVAHLSYGLEDEALALWDPDNDKLGFDKATWVARTLVRRGDARRAWEVLEGRLSAWWPFSIWAVAPVELLVDPDLAPLLTKERCEQVLATARGAQAASDGKSVG